MDFCGKSWILKKQDRVSASAVNFVADCDCLDVRILGLKPEIWIIDLSSAMVGMLVESLSMTFTADGKRQR